MKDRAEQPDERTSPTVPPRGVAPTRDQKRSAQRDRILRAARTLFSERGPETVTVADVAQQAGVSRATVFNHFGSKHALLEGITEAVLGDYNTILRNALEAEATPVPALLRSLFDFMGAGIEAQRRFHRAVFREIAKLTLGLDEGGPGQRARQRAVDQLTTLVLRGQERGELSTRHRADDLAAAFDSLVFGTITHWLYDDESESLRLRMARAADVFLGPVELGNNDGTGPGDPLPPVDGPHPTSGSRLLRDPNET